MYVLSFFNCHASTFVVKRIWCLTLVMGASIVMECILAKDSRRRATVCIPPEIYETLCLHAYVIYCDFTVKFLNFGTPEIFAVMYLKFKQRGQTLRYFVKNMQME